MMRPTANHAPLTQLHRMPPRHACHKPHNVPVRAPRPQVRLHARPELVVHGARARAHAVLEHEAPVRAQAERRHRHGAHLERRARHHGLQRHGARVLRRGAVRQRYVRRPLRATSTVTARARHRPAARDATSSTTNDTAITRVYWRVLPSAGAPGGATTATPERAAPGLVAHTHTPPRRANAHICPLSPVPETDTQWRRCTLRARTPGWSSTLDPPPHPPAPSSPVTHASRAQPSHGSATRAPA